MRRQRLSEHGQSMVEYLFMTMTIIAAIVWVSNRWGFLQTGLILMDKVRTQLTASGGTADEFLP